jgi:hypothetical protein
MGGTRSSGECCSRGRIIGQAERQHVRAIIIAVTVSRHTPRRTATTYSHSLNPAGFAQFYLIYASKTLTVIGEFWFTLRNWKRNFYLEH